MKYSTMLFDLDGTLVDTAPDLVAALNHVLRAYGKSEVAYDDAKKCVSKGGKALVRFGFGIDDAHPEFLQYHKELLAYYKEHIAVYSQFFPGMKELTKKLDKWAIVTNKPTELTYLLLDALAITPNVVVCGDTLDQNKPSALPIEYAMQQLEVTKSIMIGDDTVDYLSAKNAGIPCVIVGWGYSEVPEYEYFANTSEELHAWIA